MRHFFRLTRIARLASQARCCLMRSARQITSRRRFCFVWSRTRKATGLRLICGRLASFCTSCCAAFRRSSLMMMVRLRLFFTVVLLLLTSVAPHVDELYDSIIDGRFKVSPLTAHANSIYTRLCLSASLTGWCSFSRLPTLSSVCRDAAYSLARSRGGMRFRTRQKTSCHTCCVPVRILACSRV